MYLLKNSMPYHEYPSILMIGGVYLKKLAKSIVIIVVAVFFLVSNVSFGADDVSFKDQIKKEDGSLFEKIIAECIRWYCPNGI